MEVLIVLGIVAFLALSVSRVSQLRGSHADSWKRFHGDG